MVCQILQAIGNVLGSNIANIGLVLGIITIIYPISLKQRFYNTDFPLLIMSTVLFYYVIYTESQISRVEGIILVIAIILISVSYTHLTLPTRLMV